MARTVRQVVSGARGVLQDVRAPYRYSDDELARTVSDAIGEMRRIRPELFIASLRAELPMYTAATMDTNAPVPDMYFVPLVNFVAGRAELRDDQFTTDGRAVTLLQLFASSIGGRNP